MCTFGGEGMVNGIQAYRNYEIVINNFQKIRSYDAAGQNLHQAMSGIIAASQINQSQSLVRQEVGTFLTQFSDATNLIKASLDTSELISSSTSNDFANITTYNPDKSSLTAEITQLASPQISRTQSFDPEGDSLASEDTLTISLTNNNETFSYSIDTSAFDNNRDILVAISNDINVTSPLEASVEESDDGLSLSVRSAESDDDQSFTISSNNEYLSFSVETEASNLIATIDNTRFNQDSNIIQTDEYRLEALSTTEESTITLTDFSQQLIQQQEALTSAIDTFKDVLESGANSVASQSTLEKLDAIEREFDEVNDEIVFEQFANQSPEEATERLEAFAASIDEALSEIEEIPKGQFIIPDQPTYNPTSFDSNFYQSLFIGNSIDITL